MELKWVHVDSPKHILRPYSPLLPAYVKDGAFPALYDTTTVIVNVLDENDNRPVFRDQIYYLEIPENSAQAVVHTVMATDEDDGAFGQVTYDIAGEWA